MTLHPYDPVTKISGDLAAAVGYILGRFNSSVAAGHDPDWLVYWYKQLDGGDHHWLCRERTTDLMEGGDVVISWRPDYLYILDPAHQEAPPPVIIPPVQPPPVTPPPVTPPQPPATGINMTITRAGGMRIIFLDWFEDGVEVTLIAPDGRIVNKTKTGAKGSEYGLHSCEAGFAAVDGSYLLQIGSEKFSLPVNGSGAIKLHFERTVAPPEEEMVQLVSVPLVEPRAGTVLVTANHLALDRLGIDSLFKEVKV